MIQLETAGSSGATVGSILAMIEGDPTSFMKAIDSVENATNKGTKASESIWNGFLERIGHRIVDFGLNAAKSLAGVATSQISKALDVTTKFQTELANVSTLSNLSMDKLKAGIEGVAIKLGEDLINATKGVYQTISAGISGSEEEVIRFVEVATTAAKAGLSTTEVAVDGLTAVIAAYGLTANDASMVSDVFFKTVLLGKVNFEQLSSTIGEVTGLAAQMGIRFQEVFGMIAQSTLTTNNASKSVTQFKAAIAGLMQPSTEAEQVLQRVFGTFENMKDVIADPNKGLLEVFRRLEKDGPYSLQQVYNSTEALSFAFSMLKKDHGEATQEMIQGMNDAEGASSDALEKMADTWQFQWNRMKSIIDVIYETFMGPFVALGTDIIRVMADWFSSEKGDQILDIIQEWAEDKASAVKGFIDQAMQDHANGKSWYDIVKEWIEKYTEPLLEYVLDVAIVVGKAFVEGMKIGFEMTWEAFKAGIWNNVLEFLGVIDEMIGTRDFQAGGAGNVDWQDDEQAAREYEDFLDQPDYSDERTFENRFGRSSVNNSNSTTININGFERSSSELAMEVERYSNLGRNQDLRGIAR